MTATLDRPHVWLPGASDTPEAPLLLLHGTGGDEHDLLPLRDHLAPTAPVLSVRGSVLENGMPRFFRRLREGVFDEEDLRTRVDELTEFLTAAEQEYDVEPGTWRAVGFSNGANIASATLLRRPAALAGAVLLAAMVPFRTPPRADLSGKRVAVVNGQADPMATPEHTATLTEQLRAAGATVSVHTHQGGHTIDPQVLPAVAEFLHGANHV
ncbi:phospholipase/carboxylesterase [Haloechinothrix alba]|uniref:Phospholipase/carboxylesterase n=1 Tax=Haloechinothrix alba TaxID=664784 RepID=A0A238W5S9_9PSEU|nr:alpha/beta hydrolase [Haloechinothrix alba]SNR41920.1 phospholipase/carboxylesterase [Haloechinothrix alba]